MHGQLRRGGAELEEEIPLRYEVVESSQVGGALSKGVLTKVSLKAAEARLANPVAPLSNLKMHLIAKDGEQIPGSLYGKVLAPLTGTSTGVSIRFTSISPEIHTFLKSFMPEERRQPPALADEHPAIAK